MVYKARRKLVSGHWLINHWVGVTSRVRLTTDY